MSDVSIDLETLGTAYDAPIVAIGAQAFDRFTGKMGSTFYAEIDFKSATNGCRVDGETIAWWMRQSEAARQLFAESRRDKKTHLATALQQLGDWIRNMQGPCVWGNGATFDITILEHAYTQCSVGLSIPWQPHAIRDMRTAVELSGYDNSISFVGDRHNAMHDATHQAKVISWCCVKIATPLGYMPKVKAKPAPAPKPQPEEDDEEL